jgi:beta-lactamase superfamily II metal-dependent hydrolase
MAQIHFLNVGEGDCTWIQHANGANTIIDTCMAKADEIRKAMDSQAMEFSAAPNSVKGNFNQAQHPENPIKYLRKFSVKSVFRFILSHPDMDHMDGLKDFFAAFQPANFWDIRHNKQQDFSKPCRYSEDDWKFYQSIRGSNDDPKCLYLYAGDKGKYWNEGDDSRSRNGLSILSPTKSLVDDANKCGDYNDCSYVILYRTGKFKVLFCGDACNKTFTHLIENHKNDISDIDLLIAPHHGRKGTIDFAFLDIMKPTMTFFGNADSKDLAYNEWNRRRLEKITNNQGGTLIARFENNDGMSILSTCESFAKRYREDDTIKKDPTMEAWHLKTIYK